MTEARYAHWHHAPPHVFTPNTTYCLTAGTLHKQRLFSSPEKLDFLANTIFRLCEACSWQLEAWALFSNHYHLVAHAAEHASSTETLFRRIHSDTAVWLNETDNCPGRTVWHNYWETALTFEKSYYARLHYVHDNPVRHGAAPLAENYKWCSMGWFVQRGRSSFVRKVLSFGIERVKLPDDFDPV
jgi:putative transposase